MHLPNASHENPASDMEKMVATQATRATHETGSYRDSRVPDGWTPKGWANRLIQLAERCEVTNPDQAAEYRQRALTICADNEIV